MAVVGVCAGDGDGNGCGNEDDGEEGAPGLDEEEEGEAGAAEEAPPLARGESMGDGLTEVEVVLVAFFFPFARGEVGGGPGEWWWWASVCCERVTSPTLSVLLQSYIRHSTNFPKLASRFFFTNSGGGGGSVCPSSRPYMTPGVTTKSPSV